LGHIESHLIHIVTINLSSEGLSGVEGWDSISEDIEEDNIHIEELSILEVELISEGGSNTILKSELSVWDVESSMLNADSRVDSSNLEDFITLNVGEGVDSLSSNSEVDLLSISELEHWELIVISDNEVSDVNSLTTIDLLLDNEFREVHILWLIDVIVLISNHKEDVNKLTSLNVGSINGKV
jgi:hypothetical protein